MNTKMRSIGIYVLIYGVWLPTSIECMNAFKKRFKKQPKNSLTLPKIEKDKTRSKRPLGQAIKDLISLKKLPASSSVAPISSPGLVASQTPTKTVDALTQVRRQPSSKPPVLLQALALPLSPTSPDTLPSPGALTTSSSGGSGLFVLSSPSSVSTISSLPSPSPESGSGHDVASMLQISPALMPEKRDSSPRDFSPLPASAALMRASSHGDDSPPSKHVHVGSLGDAESIALPQGAGNMRDELEDYVEDEWTDLMWSAWNGNIKRIKTTEFTFEDVIAWHRMPGGEEENALTLAQKGSERIHELLEDNIVWVLEQYCPDTQYEREVLKPLASNPEGRPRWFTHYRALHRLFSELGDWTIDDVRKNQSDEKWIAWYRDYCNEVAGLEETYGKIFPEDRQEYDQLMQWRDSYQNILQIFESKRLEHRS